MADPKEQEYLNGFENVPILYEDAQLVVFTTSGSGAIHIRDKKTLAETITKHSPHPDGGLQLSFTAERLEPAEGVGNIFWSWRVPPQYPPQ